MILLSAVAVIFLLLFIARSSARSARQARRIPCGVCGEPLLPAARVCPNCRNRVPQSGVAGMRERLWQTAPPKLSDRSGDAHHQRQT